MFIKKTMIQSISGFQCDFFFFNCRLVYLYKVPACLLLNFSFVYHIFLFSFLVTALV